MVEVIANSLQVLLHEFPEEFYIGIPAERGYPLALMHHKDSLVNSFGQTQRHVNIRTKNREIKADSLVDFKIILSSEYNGVAFTANLANENGEPNAEVDVDNVVTNFSIALEDPTLKPLLECAAISDRTTKIYGNMLPNKKSQDGLIAEDIRMLNVIGSEINRRLSEDFDGLLKKRRDTPVYSKEENQQDYEEFHLAAIVRAMHHMRKHLGSKPHSMSALFQS